MKFLLGKSETQEFRNSGNLRCPLFEFLKFRIPDIWWLEMMSSWKSWKVEDEEWPDINFPLIKSTKAWIWISSRSKNMKRFCAKTNQLFYLQIRESLSQSAYRSWNIMVPPKYPPNTVKTASAQRNLRSIISGLLSEDQRSHIPITSL